MFYKNKSKNNRNLFDFSNEVHIEETESNTKNGINTEKINFTKDSENISNSKLRDIYEAYSKSEINTSKFIEGFRKLSIYSESVENQISELFSNVGRLLKQGNKELIEHALEQIVEGKDNISRFIEEQKDYIDENTLELVNLILKEYLNYIDYLNKALEVL